MTTKQKNTLLIRLDDETAKRLNEIVKAKRWTKQTLGEVMIEYYLEALERAAKQQAAKAANGEGK